MYSKKDQTRWNKKKNDRKLSRREYKAFCDSIADIEDGMCQWCGERKGDDFHHASYGRMGADKDDRTLVLLCRECHVMAHSGKNRDALVALGKANWLTFKGSGWRF